MAIIKCPECGRDVADDAEKCWFCSNTILKQPIKKIQKTKSRRNNFRGWLIFISIVMAGTLLVRITRQSRDSLGNENVSKSNSTENLTTNGSTQFELIEELPPPKTCYSSMGRLKLHSDGYSIGNRTEITELRKYLKNKDCDVIEITWAWDSSPKYDDMTMKIIYDKLSANLKLIYTQRNVIEEYENIIPICLAEFLRNEKDFYNLQNYCLDTKYDFNNREMYQTAKGTKPYQNEFDGSVEIVKEYLSNQAKNIEFIEWSKVSAFGENWIVRCKFRRTNSNGALLTENYWFYMQDGSVVDHKKIE